ncbi:Disaggregatase related repeat protein [Burkholderiales bacterium JOSHI_001]|nr:Disaggregatase related repeat protein [Burkholderiales bacterium JOSHI_001]
MFRGVALATPLVGCGGGSGTTAAGTTSDGPPAVDTASNFTPVTPVIQQNPVVESVKVVNPLVSGAARYRHQHTYLFQGSAWSVQAARIPGGTNRSAVFGPNSDHVDAYCGWPWDKAGGDWLDRDGVRHGPTPWTTAVTQVGPVGLIQSYDIDVTEVVRKVFADNRWCAFRLAPLKGQRAIAGLWNKTQPSPKMSVQYTDGTRADLRCVITAEVKSGVPNQISEEIWLPAFVEFERPAKAVQSATISLTVTQHPNNIAAEVAVFLLDPPVNRDAVRYGVAAKVGALDAGIESAPGIIGAHRYVDGTALSDFVHPEPSINTWASREFDPALWGGTPDTTKLPHKGLGKFITTSIPNWADLVDSSHTSDGFKPLAPGVGALKVRMPSEVAADGDVVGYGGSGGANASIFLPEPLFGRLPRIFVRHYFRLGTPEGSQYVRDPKKRLQVYHLENQQAPVWTDWAGKFGITPDHTTSFGGTSGSAGGGRGWQMRLAWSDCDAAFNGPSEGGVRPGFHLFDFGVFNPKGYNYSGDTDSNIYWGQRGGAGGMLYANQWYCIETEMVLNTVMDTAPGFLPDGELRAWLDGVLVFERKGLVFRSKPLYQPPLDPTTLGAVRDLGVRALWLNWYHGGVTKNTVDRTMFISGLAWGTEYIGPMKA